MGGRALRTALASPDFEVVGVKVFSPHKDGVDVGTLVGAPPIGVRATTSKAAILALDAWSLRAAALTIHSLTDDAHWVVTANAANAAAMSAMGCAKQHAKDAATAARDGRDLGGISRDLHRELAARLTMARAPSSAWSADLAGVWLSGTDVPRTLRDHQAFSELADAPLAPAVQDDGAPTDAP